MKQVYWKVTMIVMEFIFCMNAYAYDFEANGIYYGYNAANQTAYVTYGTEKYSGNVVIPESVTFNGRIMAVASIGPIAFEYCNDLYSVSIPNSVTTIGDRAFSGSGLKSVDIPNSVTTIEPCAFENCNLTSLFIPSSIMTIGKDAFAHCELLETLVIEDSEKPIEIHYFNYDPFKGSNPKYVYVGRDCISYSVLSYIPMDSRLATIFSIGKNVKYVRYTSNTLTTIYSASVTPEDMEIDFLNSTYLNATLYVPTGTKEKYMAAEGWKNFFNIQEMDVADMWDGKNEPPTSNEAKEKCAKPTIRYSNGKLLFESTTEGAICQSTITDSDITSYSGNEVQLGVTYNISVYATATGYEDSDVATATLCWIDVDPKTEGIENNVSQVRARAILIQANNGTLSISGAEDGTNIDIYTSSGMMIGSAKSSGDSTSIATGLRNGEIVIVKIGDKAVKVVMK